MSRRTRWYLWRLAPALPLVVFAVWGFGHDEVAAAIIAAGSVATIWVQVASSVLLYRSGFLDGRLAQMVVDSMIGRGLSGRVDLSNPNPWDPLP